MKVGNAAVESLRQLRRQVAKRKIVCSVDGGFTNQTVFRNIPEDTILIGRIRKDAKLFSQPEESCENEPVGRRALIAYDSKRLLKPL